MPPSLAAKLILGATVAVKQRFRWYPQFYIVDAYHRRVNWLQENQIPTTVKFYPSDSRWPEHQDQSSQLQMAARKLFVFASSMDGGGSEKQTLMLLQGLCRQTWKPELFLLYRRGALLDQLPPDVPIRAFWEEHPAPRLWVPGRIHRMQVRWLRQALKEHSPAAIYDRTYHATLITSPASQELSVGRVSTITSPPEQELIRSRDRWIAFKKRRLAEAYRTASYTVAVSHSTARSAEAFYGLPGDFVKVVPSPIDLQAIQLAAAIPLKLSLPTDRIHIACVGRMTVEKGHLYLLQALRNLAQCELPRFHVWFAGDGPLRPELEKFVQSHNLQTRVTFLGHLPSAASLIRRVHALCIPSLYEGLPNVIMEAMALRTPVIATATGGALELSDAEDCFRCVPPADSSRLAEELTRLILRPQEFEPALQKAHDFIQQRDCSIIIPQLSHLLQQAAENAFPKPVGTTSCPKV
jgi:glycosyltransferase involved in cell wall biosynthesis